MNQARREIHCEDLDSLGVTGAGVGWLCWTQGFMPMRILKIESLPSRILSVIGDCPMMTMDMGHISRL